VGDEGDRVSANLEPPEAIWSEPGVFFLAGVNLERYSGRMPVQRFTEKRRWEAVRRVSDVIDRHQIGVQAAVSKVANELGIGESTLWEWRKKAYVDLTPASGPPGVVDHRAGLIRDGIIFRDFPMVVGLISTIRVLADNQMRDLEQGRARPESVREFVRAASEDLRKLAKSI
jgi:hypothetical protein